MNLMGAGVNFLDQPAEAASQGTTGFWQTQPAAPVRNALLPDGDKNLDTPDGAQNKAGLRKVRRLLLPKTFVWEGSPPFDYGHPAETLAEGSSPTAGIAWGLLVAERQFRRVIGYREIPLLLSSIENAASKKSAAPVAKGAREIGRASCRER